MADVTSCERARDSRGMSAGSFSRRAAGNLQNLVVLDQKTHLGPSAAQSYLKDY